MIKEQEILPVYFIHDQILNERLSHKPVHSLFSGAFKEDNLICLLDLVLTDTNPTSRVI